MSAMLRPRGVASTRRGAHRISCRSRMRNGRRRLRAAWYGCRSRPRPTCRHRTWTYNVTNLVYFNDCRSTEARPVGSPEHVEVGALRAGHRSESAQHARAEEPVPEGELLPYHTMIDAWVITWGLRWGTQKPRAINAYQSSLYRYIGSHSWWSTPEIIACPANPHRGITVLPWTNYFRLQTRGSTVR